MSKSTIRRMWVMVVMVVGMLALAAPAAWATDFTVTNTNDSGAGSLRWAIVDANDNQGPDTIKFNIPGAGVHKIAPLSQLPGINDSVVIDGYTQPGASPNTKAVGNDAVLKIELNGTDAAPMGVSGLRIGGSNVVVRGLVINHFSTGIKIFYSDVPTDNTRIEGNFIGTDPSGTIDKGNRGIGVAIEGATNNTVGGTSPEARNLISGNDTSGVVITHYGSASGNKVEGNYIGTDATGAQDLGNGAHGVLIDGAPTNAIGGTSAGTRNVISGNAQSGVFISYSSARANLVQGNYIGTDATGTKDLGNSFNGVRIEGAPNNTIGGTASGARNMISGNGTQGVSIRYSSASGNKVEGNYIGTDATGAQDLGNGAHGVLIDGAPTNAIGGTSAGTRNVISGNARTGVAIGGSGASGNKVEGNYIGTDATGAQDLGNSSNGLEVVDAPTNTIGGTVSGARNIISGNDTNGVVISYGSSHNKVEGNYIGTDATGTKDLGNSFNGVLVPNAAYGAHNNTIGGTASEARNIIAFNDRDGVAVVGRTSTANAVLSNSVFSNRGLGIDLGDNGLSANDSGDGDTGPNNLQNFPTLTKANMDRYGFTKIEGTLNSTPSSTFKVQFFSSPQKDPSGNGEGKMFLGEQSVTTNSSGNAALSFTTSQAKDGEFLSATATGPNSNTSEFSNALIVNTRPEATSQSLTTDEDTVKTITLSATDAEGDALSFEIIDQPRHGVLSPIGAVTCEAAAKSCEADLTYTPDKDYYGEDSFSYKATDGDLESVRATVNITVNSGDNDAPKATDDAYSVDEDQTLSVPDGSTDVLANDSEVDGESLRAVQVAGPAHGQLTLNADGSFTYTPSKDYYGTDSFTYKASDGTLESNIATVRITVKDATAPDAPVITSPAEGSYDNDGSFTLSGTAEPYSSVLIFDGGNKLDREGQVSDSGTWSYDLSDVSEGSHSYTAKVADPAGNISATSESRTVIVDKSAPGAPLITYPAQGARLNYRSFSLSGTTEAGAKVELFEGALSKGTATADTYGRWRIPLSGVSEGSHSYTAKATDQAGNTSAPSSTRTVIVDLTKPKVSGVDPAENATAIMPYTNVTATFSEAMKASTINTTTFKLYKKDSTTAITATVSYDATAKKATLNPSADLEPEVTYKALVTTGAKDLAGNALDQNPTLTGNQNKVWYFKVILDPTDQ